MERRREVNLHQLFRYFTGAAVLYFAVIGGFTRLKGDQRGDLLEVQAYINFATNLIQFIYLSTPFFKHRLRQFYLPIALLNATIVPIFSNLVYWSDPLENISFVIMRSWLLFPILMVPIALIAGIYRFRYVILTIVVSTGLELFILIPHIDRLDSNTLQILGGPLVRAFAIGTIGYLVNQLMTIQRSQRKDLILANIRLSEYTETLEQLATSRERNRIAREFHDTLAHTLSGQAVHLEAIKLMISEDQNEVHKMLQQSLDHTRAGLAETRRALKSLRSQQLDDVGLDMGIRHLVTDAASRAGFKANVVIQENILELTPDLEQGVYRIVQEAIENIVRHAQAENVDVFLDVSGGQLEVVIRDDGTGFSPEATDLTNILGLQGMKERAQIIHGDLKIMSQENLGTTIQLSVPISRMRYIGHD